LGLLLGALNRDTAFLRLYVRALVVSKALVAGNRLGVAA
jgi:hypothetical protein